MFREFLRNCSKELFVYPYEELRVAARELGKQPAGNVKYVV